MNRANRDGGSTAPSCSAAIGGTRVARAAGTTAESSVTRMPTASATTTVRGASTRPLCGMSMLGGLEELDDAGGDAEAGEDAQHRREQAHDERLAGDAEQHLAPRGAEGAQHGELAAPLGDGHREGVEDDEGADEHGDAAERRAAPGAGTRRWRR